MSRHQMWEWLTLFGILMVRFIWPFAIQFRSGATSQDEPSVRGEEQLGGRIQRDIHTNPDYSDLRYVQETILNHGAETITPTANVWPTYGLIVMTDRRTRPDVATKHPRRHPTSCPNGWKNSAFVFRRVGGSSGSKRFRTSHNDICAERRKTITMLSLMAQKGGKHPRHVIPSRIRIYSMSTTTVRRFVNLGVERPTVHVLSGRSIRGALPSSGRC